MHSIFQINTGFMVYAIFSFLCLTDPDDVARVESKTLISTPDKYSTVPHVKEGVQGILGRWMAPDELNQNLTERYPACEKGRTMHVIPYSMGPLGSPISKYGVELTDSAYVTINMFIMTRVSPKVWGYIRENDGQFVRCMHSIGLPKYAPLPPRPTPFPLLGHLPQS